MRNQPHILVLSGDLGEGHMQAAQAIQEAAVSCPQPCRVQMINIMDLLSPSLHVLAKHFFLNVLNSFPFVYRFFYERTKQQGIWSLILKHLRLIPPRKLLDLLHTFSPDIVVCTFPMAAAALSHLKEKGLWNNPMVTIITDHTSHSYWIHPETDHYIVASRHIRDALIEKGIKKENITACGIPVRMHFTHQYDRLVMAKKHGISPNIPTMLWMGGGQGMLREEILWIIDTLRETCPFLQMIIVCGKNQKLLRQCQQRFRSYSQIHCTGFIHHVHELMALSDFIVTKSGGLTTSEALSQSLPMLIYRPLPGQEEENASYLIHTGAAWMADNAEQLLQQIQLLTKHPRLLERMRERMKSLQNRTSATHALQTIVGLHHQNVTASCTNISVLLHPTAVL